MTMKSTRCPEVAIYIANYFSRSYRDQVFQCYPIILFIKLKNETLFKSKRNYILILTPSVPLHKHPQCKNCAYH